jgi:hypothetical protein
LGCERLEGRVTPSLTIQIDYSLDSSGFFAEHPAAETVLQEAAGILGSQVNDSLSAIAPSPGTGNTWTADFTNPSSGSQTSVDNLSIPAGTILVYAGGYTTGGSFIGVGGPGGYTVQGSDAWINQIETRGANRAIGIWGGVLQFSTTADWSFADTSVTPPANGLDFLSVAEHELGHVLGIGTSSGWQADVSSSNDTFIGPHAEASYGRPVPLNSAGQNGETADSHWGSSVTSFGQVPTMSVNPFYPGERRLFTPLDWAGLQDIGWHTDHLAVTTEPPGRVSVGGGFGLAVSAEDPNGHVDTTFNGAVGLALAGGPAGATLGGTLTATAQNGVATFSGLTFNQAGDGYTIQASANRVTATTTSRVDVGSIPTGSKLIVTAAPPSPLVAGNPFGLTVAFEGPGGQVDPTFEGAVTLVLTSGPPGASLNGPMTVLASQGLATFSELSLDTAGGYTISATVGGVSTTTNPFAVLSAPASQLVVRTEPPSSVPLGNGFGFIVTAEDPFGNVDTSFDQFLTASLTNTLGNGFSGGGVTVGAIGGVASFSDFFVGTPGTGFTIRVTSAGGGLSVLTTPFSVGVGSPGSGGPPPTVVGERVLTAVKGHHQHLVGFEVDFSSALAPSHASPKANYTVTQFVRRGRKLVAQSVRFTAHYDPASAAVRLLVAGKPAFAQGGRIVINASPPSGIMNASGDYLAGNTVFIILPGGRGVHG